MKEQSRRLVVGVILSALLLGACRLVDQAFQPTPTAAPAATLSAAASFEIGEISFCGDVTDDGECLNPGTDFPADTHTVWALFSYAGMENGLTWSRLWQRDGEVYIEAEDEIWEDGEQGWLAYSITDETDLSGSYTFTVSVEGEDVAGGDFTVQSAAATEQEGFPSFGPVTFAQGVDANIPIKPADQFEVGLKKIYAVFPYVHMREGQPWACAWSKDGEELVHSDFEWDTGRPDGIYSCSFEYDGGEELGIGEYQLSLYIDNQVARSATAKVIQVQANVQGPAAPEELIVPDLLPAYYSLLNHPLEILRSVAQESLDYRIPMQVGDQCGDGAVACFKYSCDDRTSGEIYVSPGELNQAEPLLAASLAHELTHAVQLHAGWKCGCTVEKEYYAVAAEIDALWYGGYEDLVNERYGALWTSEGKMDTNMLWQVVKEAYHDCPEY